MAKQQLTIATRGSPLALWQAEWVQTRLQAMHPNLVINLFKITTTGDKFLSAPLAEIGGKGLFVKELEEALLNSQADIAVHSMKDVPMGFPAGLFLPVICERDDPSDVLVSSNYASLQALPDHAVVGTSSVRRQSQLLALRPTLTLKNLRGNVGTRVSKLDNGDYDAVILAAAGLKRLGMQARIRQTFHPTQLLPAAGQGALGIECRENDAETIALIQPLIHVATAACVNAERAMCRGLNGNCQVPIAAYAVLQNNKIDLHGLVANPTGTRVLRTQQQGSMQEIENIGSRAAEDLLQQGAGEILREFAAR